MIGKFTHTQVMSFIVLCLCFWFLFGKKIKEAV